MRDSLGLSFALALHTQQQTRDSSCAAAFQQQQQRSSHSYTRSCSKDGSNGSCAPATAVDNSQKDLQRPRCAAVTAVSSVDINRQPPALLWLASCSAAGTHHGAQQQCGVTSRAAACAAFRCKDEGNGLATMPKAQTRTNAPQLLSEQSWRFQKNDRRCSTHLSGWRSPPAFTKPMKRLKQRKTRCEVAERDRPQ